MKYYYIEDNFEEKKELYTYLRDNFITKNIYYLFFIGKNATMPTHYYYMDINGAVTNQYHYQSLAFYTRILNNDFEYDNIENIYLKKRFLNCPITYPVPRHINSETKLKEKTNYLTHMTKRASSS